MSTRPSQHVRHYSSGKTTKVNKGIFNRVKKFFSSGNKNTNKSIYEMSMREKVQELGYNPDEFQKDMMAVDNTVTNKLTIPVDFRKETIEKEVYPELRKFKGKYKLDMPIGMTGVDIKRLDTRLNQAVEDKRIK